MLAASNNRADLPFTVGMRPSLTTLNKIAAYLKKDLRSLFGVGVAGLIYNP
jgi:hypothetical protein